MLNIPSASALAATTAPLWSNFGSDLTLWRDGDVVNWSYEGQTVIVAQQDGVACASFVDVPMVDQISGRPASAVYRRTAERRYALTEESSRAMVADMVAFFSGDREPLFTFVDTRSIDA